MLRTSVNSLERELQQATAAAAQERALGEQRVRHLEAAQLGLQRALDASGRHYLALFDCCVCQCYVDADGMNPLLPAPSLRPALVRPSHIPRVAVPSLPPYGLRSSLPLFSSLSLSLSTSPGHNSRLAADARAGPAVGVPSDHQQAQGSGPQWRGCGGARRACRARWHSS